MLPCAKATETRLKETATASSSTSPSFFLNKTFSTSYFFTHLLNNRYTGSRSTQIIIGSLRTQRRWHPKGSSPLEQVLERSTLTVLDLGYADFVELRLCE